MASCYGNFNFDQYTSPLLGDYISCVIKQLWGVFQIIFIAVAIILIMLLIFKYVTNRENSKVLEEMGHQWLYIVLLVIVLIGGAGTLINIILKFLGFQGVQYWLDIFNQYMSDL